MFYVDWMTEGWKNFRVGIFLSKSFELHEKNNFFMPQLSVKCVYKY